MAAWVKQVASQVRKHGEKKASWYAFWNEPDGRQRSKSFGPGDAGRSRAEEFANSIMRDIESGTYNSERMNTMSWGRFVSLYKKHGMCELSRNSKNSYERSLRLFSEIENLNCVALASITSEHFDDYVEKRMSGAGCERVGTPSVCSVHRELREIRSALGFAVSLGLISDIPVIRALVRKKSRLKAFSMIVRREPALV